MFFCVPEKLPENGEQSLVEAIVDVMSEKGRNDRRDGGKTIEVGMRQDAIEGGVENWKEQLALRISETLIQFTCIGTRLVGRKKKSNHMDSPTGHFRERRQNSRHLLKDGLV
jgi:hypothetical protein